MSTKLPPTTSGDFYTLSLDGDSFLADEWPKLAAAVKGLRPYFESRVINDHTDDWDATLQGMMLGDDDARKQWRVFADNKNFYVQTNTGTDESPTWTTRLGIDHVGGIDFTALLNFNQNDFYFSGAKANPPEKVLNIRNYIRQDGTLPMDSGATLKLADAGVVFDLDQNTGITRQTDDVMNLRAGGVSTAQVKTASFEPSVPVRISDPGDATEPDFSWTADTDTGVYRPGADQVGVTVGGTQRLLIGSSSPHVTVPGDLQGSQQASFASRVMASAFYITPTAHSMTGARELLPLQVSDGTGEIYERNHLIFNSNEFYLADDQNGEPVVNLVTSGIPFGRSFESAALLMTAGLTHTLTHGLGGKPRFITARMVSQATDASYAAGDEIEVGGGHSTGGSTGFHVYIPANSTTTIAVIISNGALQVHDKSSGALTNLTNANWRLRVIAYL